MACGGNGDGSELSACNASAVLLGPFIQQPMLDITAL